MTVGKQNIDMEKRSDSDRVLSPNEDLKWTAQKQSKMYYMSKFLFICGAAGMVIISALRFTVVDLESVH